jgi:hypothetical protein
VILAGPLSHFSCAWLIFALCSVFGELERPGIVRSDADDRRQAVPGAVAGLQAGDVIVRIGDLDQPNARPDRHLPGGARRRSRSPYVVDRTASRSRSPMTPSRHAKDGTGVAIGIERRV